MKQRLNAEQGHGMCGEGPVHPSCGLRGSHGKLELAGWQDGCDFSKLAYLASKVNTNLRSLSREGAVQ